METLTIVEAAEASGISKKAMRNRVDRGQIRSVLRDGVRRIPRSELERAGLSAGVPFEAASLPQDDPGSPPAEAGATEAWKEVLERLERQAGELAELRVLTRRAESLREERDRLEAAVHRERAERQAAEAQLAELAQAQETDAQRLEQLMGASFFARRRLVRELRAGA
jgi:hypothetical protein